MEKKSTTCVDGNGCRTVNPLIWADIPDPDVICVDGVYYMTSTTMYFTPGIPIMKSVDLVNWELIGYVYDILDDSDSNALRNGANAYGKGSWASSLRYNNGRYYVVAAALNTQKTYLFHTDNIESCPWERHEIEGFYHDSSLLFDDDGRVYLVYGGGTIRIIELTQDVTAIKENGLSKVIIENANEVFGGGADNGLPGEGAHFYKINGRYYIFLIAWPKTGNARRAQICYRSDSIEGPYEGRIVLDDDMGYKNCGVAQGGLVEQSKEARYAMLFQDHGAVGRIPMLVPVTWTDGWPVFGVDGRVLQDLPELSRKSSNGSGLPSVVCCDEFDAENGKLAPPWQFNHNPDNNLWSLSERPGYLRLKTGCLSKGLLDARNTLTQRTFGPACSGTVCIETGGMKDGDTAGFAALQELYGYAGVTVKEGKKYIVMGSAYAKSSATDAVSSTQIDAQRVYLRIDFDFDDADCANFYYSLDETEWHSIGDALNMEYRLSHFTGYRFALFYYATQTPGGFADFDYFRVTFINNYLYL